MKHAERAAHIAREDYDATAHSPYLIADVVPLMGKRAKLTLTGTLVDCGQSREGTYVKFKVDDRFGLSFNTLVMDVDPFEVES